MIIPEHNQAQPLPSVLSYERATSKQFQKADFLHDIIPRFLVQV